jgi:hypothetical protein
MTTRIIALGASALLLAACGLGVDGLGPDLAYDAGSRTLEPVDGSVGSPARPTPSPTVDAKASSMTDAPSASSDSGGSLEGGSCVLPSRATLCCGSVACTDGDGTCATAGVCALCQANCTDPKKPVCCAASSKMVTCSATPDGC